MPLHTKLDPQPAWLMFEEIAVRLDSGEIVTVSCDNAADLLGGTAINVTARAVHADGTPRHGANGMPIVAMLRHPYKMSELPAGARLVDIQRDCVRVALGEPTTYLYIDAAGQARRAALSIRNKLRHAGDAAVASAHRVSVITCGDIPDTATLTSPRSRTRL